MDGWATGTLEMANTLLGWFKSSPYRAVLTMLILSAAFLLFIGHSLDKTGLAGWAIALRFMAWGVFAFCIVWLVLALMEIAVRHGCREIEWRRYLKALTPAEKEVFQIFISQDTTTQTFTAAQLTAVSLATKGFFLPVQPSYDQMKGRGFLPYEIKRRILKYLKKNPALLQ